MDSAASRRERIRSTVRYYRTVADHIEREHQDRADRSFWIRASEERAPGARVLEVGCGTGRVTALLAPRAGSVVAVDLSPDMLRRARERFGAASSVYLLRADVLALPLGAAFDLAVAANGVFSHLLRDEQRLRALRQIRGRLRPGATLLVDAFWLSRDRRSRCVGPEGDRRRRSVGTGPDSLEVTERWVCDPESARCRVLYRYRDEPEGPIEEAESVLRHWTADEVHRLFPEAGLRVTATWGDYDRSGWGPNSRRLVVRARRPE